MAKFSAAKSFQIRKEIKEAKHFLANLVLTVTFHSHLGNCSLLLGQFTAGCGVSWPWYCLCVISARGNACRRTAGFSTFGHKEFFNYFGVRLHGVRFTAESDSVV